MSQAVCLQMRMLHSCPQGSLQLDKKARRASYAKELTYTAHHGARWACGRSA